MQLAGRVESSSVVQEILHSPVFHNGPQIKI